MILRLGAFAMGTRFELVLAGRDPAILRAAGEDALFEITDAEARLSVFRQDSVLSHVNRFAPTEDVAVDRELIELLVLCREAHRVTQGAFDPALGALMAHHGFRETQNGDDGDLSPLAVDALVAEGGFHHVQVDEARCCVRFTGRHVALDLGGIAKGWALARAAEVLRAADIPCALLHGGTSSVVALGPPPDASHWIVEILDPKTGRPAAQAHLANAGLSVSAPHGRTQQTVEGSVTHVLDPRSGRPSTGARLAVVAHPSAAWADALSTALLVDPELALEDPSRVDATAPLSTISALVLPAVGDVPRTLLRGNPTFHLTLP